MSPNKQTMSLTMARILCEFDISKAKERDGREIEVDQDEVTQSIAAWPLPFKYVPFLLHTVSRVMPS